MTNENVHVLSKEEWKESVRKKRTMRAWVFEEGRSLEDTRPRGKISPAMQPRGSKHQRHTSASGHSSFPHPQLPHNQPTLDNIGKSHSYHTRKSKIPRDREITPTTIQSNLCIHSQKPRKYIHIHSHLHLLSPQPSLILANLNLPLHQLNPTQTWKSLTEIRNIVFLLLSRHIWPRYRSPHPDRFWRRAGV